MKHSFRGWGDVATCLQQEADQQKARASEDARLNDGQCASLHAIAKRLPDNGVIIADAVGMGKTRIAVAVAACVTKCGGRVAVLVPPGLGYQWEEELRDGGLTDVPPILRSLWAYLAAWESEDPHEQKPWFANQVVMVSHAFTNWRLSDKSDSWRRALLPEVYALWRKRRYDSLPRYYRDNKALVDPWVRRAGKSIVDALPKTRSHPACKFLDRLIDEFKWDKSLKGNYGHGTKLREQLERSVGLGLGVFDLVIVDEAHKSRGDDSGLSHLLANVVLHAGDARRLCMTATPIELDVTQWEHTLGRIKVSSDAVDAVRIALSGYSKAAKQVRQCWRSGGDVLDQYKVAAEKFQEALQPYVLRRDKREDRSVQLFWEHTTGRSWSTYRSESEITTGLPWSRYRSDESEILVEVEKLPSRWQQAVCAAEALSFVARMGQDPVAKRLRLTLGNGHGIAALLDQVNLDEEHDQKQREYDEDSVATESRVAENSEDDGSTVGKRAARMKWWHAAILRAFDGEEDSLYDHPAIAAAVAAIEQATARGEKVLVFGRFTRPMRALTDLLNARAMLARKQGVLWRQTKVHGERDGTSDNSEWPAVRAAHRQLKNKLGLGVLDENELDRKLQRQYNRSDSSREKFRNALCSGLKDGFAELGLDENDKCLKAFEAFARSVTMPDGQDLPLVSRALLELSGEADFGGSIKLGSRGLAETFCDLVRSASDRDDPEADGDSDGTIDEDEADSMWITLRARIKEEYSRPQGGFARFMYGGTAQSSRRMIQLAFNRPHSFPKVLVAQSMVGREGLNLHGACRIVVLLHPEWNPGVVEQQIGRVDRVNSHWCRQLDDKIEAGVSSDQLPRIEVRPVVFRGTYDEHNWEVLRERWDDLRAQLEGIVVPDRHAGLDDESRQIIKKLESYAPSFSPLRDTL